MYLSIHCTLLNTIYGTHSMLLLLYFPWTPSTFLSKLYFVLANKLLSLWLHLLVRMYCQQNIVLAWPLLCASSFYCVEMQPEKIMISSKLRQFCTFIAFAVQRVIFLSTIHIRQVLLTILLCKLLLGLSAGYTLFSVLMNMWSSGLGTTWRRFPKRIRIFAIFELNSYSPSVIAIEKKNLYK